jgi:hypothetical protein
MAVGSYAVLWSEVNGPPVAGKLTPRRETLELSGTQDGRIMRRALAYRDVTGLRVSRMPPEVIEGRPTLVLEQRDAPDVLVHPLGPGLLYELADTLAELCSRNEPLAQVALVLPLKPGTLETVRALVDEGPPFDPSDKSLARHEVFLTANEAIFVFTGEDACESVRSIVRDSSVWSAAGRWSACLDAPPRLAEAAFNWPSP